MTPLDKSDPRTVGEYVLISRLGAGGMGRVYLARSPGGRKVAVKVVRPEIAEDPTFRARFAREVAAARAVSGFYTAPVVDADPDAPLPWLATAFVDGPDLRSAVKRHGAFPADAVVMLAAALAEALGAIHRAGLVHRDLKPSNVLLAADGPRVIDFGIAQALDQTGLTREGVIGSIGFMSPEHLSGRTVGPPSDVFSLASTLTYVATGRGPFGDEPADVLLFKIAHGEPDLSEVPEALRGVLTSCLEKDPRARPALRQILSELAPNGMPEPPPGWLTTITLATPVGGAAPVSSTPLPTSGGTPGTPLPTVTGSAPVPPTAAAAVPTATSVPSAPPAQSPAAPATQPGTAPTTQPNSPTPAVPAAAAQQMPPPAAWPPEQGGPQQGPPPPPGAMPPQRSPVPTGPTVPAAAAYGAQQAMPSPAQPVQQPTMVSPTGLAYEQAPLTQGPTNLQQTWQPPGQRAFAPAATPASAPPASAPPSSAPPASAPPASGPPMPFSAPPMPSSAPPAQPPPLLQPGSGGFGPPPGTSYGRRKTRKQRTAAATAGIIAAGVVAALVFVFMNTGGAKEPGGGGSTPPSPTAKPTPWAYQAEGLGSAQYLRDVVLSGDKKTAFAADDLGRLHAFDSATGKSRWVEQIGGQASNGTPIEVDGVVYATNDDGTLKAFDAKTGDVNWEKDLGGQAGSPLVVGDRVVVPTKQGPVRAYTLEGAEAWSEGNATVMANARPVASGGKVYVSSMAPTGVLVFDAASGSPGKMLATDKPVYASVAVGNGLIFAATSETNRESDLGDYSLTAFRANGTAAWTFRTPTPNPWAPVFVPDGSGEAAVYLNSHKGSVYRLDMKGGEKWVVSPGDESNQFGGVAVGDDLVFAARGAGLYALTADGGQEKWVDTYAGPRTPVVANGLVIVAGEQMAFAIETKTGANVTEAANASPSAGQSN